MTAEIARLRERVFELEADPNGGDVIPLAEPRELTRKTWHMAEPNMRRLLRAARLCEELGHGDDVPAALDELKRLRAENQRLAREAHTWWTALAGATAELAAAREDAERSVAEERERCSHVCKGIAASYTAEARRLKGEHATHAAGQRDGANECAAAINARGEKAQADTLREGPNTEFSGGPA